MATDILAQQFAKSYSGTRRIGSQGNSPAGESKQVFGKAVTVFRQSNQRPNRAELREWFKNDALENLSRPVYEAKRMIGDTATVCHIDYNPTAAMTPKWEAYGTAYGVRFVLTLWQEDIDFVN